jgi:hypothetical protein
MGGWNERYEVFALRNGRQLASIIGVMDMHFLFGGVEHEGVQLGAVGTSPAEYMIVARMIWTSRLEDDLGAYLIAHAVNGTARNSGLGQKPTC